MTEYTRPATWEDLKTLVGFLRDAGVEYALVDGYAIAAHGFNRITMAIDGTPVQILDLPGLLKTKQGLRPKDQMDAAVIAAAIAAVDRKA